MLSSLSIRMLVEVLFVFLFSTLSMNNTSTNMTSVHYTFNFYLYLVILVIINLYLETINPIVILQVLILQDILIDRSLIECVVYVVFQMLFSLYIIYSLYYVYIIYYVYITSGITRKSVVWILNILKRDLKVTTDDISLWFASYLFSFNYLCIVNHKLIGLYYLCLSLLLGLSGTIISILMRTEIMSSSIRILTYENQQFYYYIIITLHGLIMIFFLIMPYLYSGIGNTFIPLYLGVTDVAYPRINNISILLIPLAYLSLGLAIIIDFSIGTGWTLYPPLSTWLISLSIMGIVYLINGLIISGISSSITSLNFICIIWYYRCYGISWILICLVAWSVIITGSMLIIVLPILLGILVILQLDLLYNCYVFDYCYGGDPIFYQHIFWFFGHPEVYILIIPGFGIINVIISDLCMIIVFGNPW